MAKPGPVAVAPSQTGPLATAAALRTLPFSSVATGAQLVEQRKACLGAEHHGLAVDRLTDARKAVGPLMTTAGEQAQPAVFHARHEAIAVVLDLRCSRPYDASFPHRPHRRSHKERHHERLAPSPAIGSSGAFGFWLRVLD